MIKKVKFLDNLLLNFFSDCLARYVKITDDDDDDDKQGADLLHQHPPAWRKR